MNIRKQKRLITYLYLLIDRLDQEKNDQILEQIKKNLSNEDAIDIIQWLYSGQYEDKGLFVFKKDKLLGLINSDINILLYTIQMLEDEMTNCVSYSQREVTTFFENTQHEMHYLAHKPVNQWDGYDTSNYHSLLSKTNSTKLVYGIFASDVLPKDVAKVTTSPSDFFDTKEEAETEIQNIILERKFNRDELIIHKVWLIKDNK